jgi:hypothetical protein
LDTGVDSLLGTTETTLPKSCSHFYKEEVDFSGSEKERPTEEEGEASHKSARIFPASLIGE